MARFLNNRKRCSALVSLLLVATASASAQDLIVLNERGKPGRDVLELIGDGKTNEFGRPVADYASTEAIISKLVPVENKTDIARQVIFTGENCGEVTCLAILFYKSFHGILDVSQFKSLEFDIKIDSPPTKPVGLRIGSWPSRAEIDITNKLPNVSEGWKTIRITMDEFKRNTFDNFDFERTEDVFSFGTDGKIEFAIANIKWKQ